MVEAEHPAESLEALDRADCRCRTITGLDQPIVDPLVIPLPVIMSGILASGFPKRPFSEEDHPMETFVLDRPNEPLGIGVQVGRTRGQPDDLDAGTNQQVSKRDGVLRIPIEDDEVLVREESVDGVGEVAPDLHHPGFVRTRRDPYDLDPARRQLDDEEHVEGDKSADTPDFDREEVARSKHVPVALEKLTPRHSPSPFRGGIDSVLFQNVGDCSSANPMADVLERSLDARVSPAWILSGHSDGQFRDDLHDPRSPRGSSLVGPLLGNELAVPTKDGVGSDERSNFGESPSSNGLAAHGKSAALSVGQSKSSATELLFQDSVLLSEIFDDRILLSADPAGQGGNEDLPGLQSDCHPLIVVW